MGPPHPRPVAANNTIEDAGGAQTRKRRNATGAARKPAALSVTRDASQARHEHPAPSAEDNASNLQETGQGAPAARNETRSLLKKSASGAKAATKKRGREGETRTSGDAAGTAAAAAGPVLDDGTNLQPPFRKKARQAAKLKALKKENKRLQRELERARKQKTAATEIKTIPKPKGSAGGGKNGYNLMTAMGFNSESEDDNREYNAVLQTVRTAATAARINLNRKYLEVPAHELNVIFAQAQLVKPMLARFENDWASAAILKQYMASVRKYEKLKARKHGAATSQGAHNEADMDAEAEESSSSEEDEDEDAREEEIEEEDEGGDDGDEIDQ